MTEQTQTIPEKFRDLDTGGLKTDLLLSSYVELERRLSRVPAPPKTPEGYEISIPHSYFGVDAEMNKKLHEKGFTNEQVQFVYDLAAEKMVPLVMQMAADYNADREIEKLVQHFGGEEKWQEVARQLLAFGQKNLPVDVLDTLASSFDGVMALYRMMKSDEPSLTRVPDKVQESGNGALELQSMMRDPKYWREQDPSFIAKVTEGFQKLYGGK